MLKKNVGYPYCCLLNPPEDAIIICILKTKFFVLTKIQEFVRGHADPKWRSWDLNLKLIFLVVKLCYPSWLFYVHRPTFTLINNWSCFFLLHSLNFIRIEVMKSTSKHHHKHQSVSIVYSSPGATIFLKWDCKFRGVIETIKISQGECSFKWRPRRRMDVV